jgi:hypothetical protein
MGETGGPMKAEENGIRVRLKIEFGVCRHINSAEFGVCRKVERYTAKILAHPIDKRTSPINRTRNPTDKG